MSFQVDEVSAALLGHLSLPEVRFRQEIENIEKFSITRKPQHLNPEKYLKVSILTKAWYDPGRNKGKCFFWMHSTTFRVYVKCERKSNSLKKTPNEDDALNKY